MKAIVRYHRHIIVILLLWYCYITLHFTVIFDETSLSSSSLSSRATSVQCPYSTTSSTSSLSFDWSILSFDRWSGNIQQQQQQQQPNNVTNESKYTMLNDDTNSDNNNNSSTATLCHDDDMKQSFQFLWEERIKNTILNVSLLQTEWSHDLRSRPEFVQWVYDSMQYFTYERLQHTQLSIPMEQQRIFGHIRNIINNKLQHHPTTTTTTSVSPLRIVVFGGSVPRGHGCLENIFQYHIRKDGKDNSRHNSNEVETNACAWPGRLQDMMDAVLGVGTVIVTNMAMGGARTEMSTSVLDFGLLPIDKIPHIIIWDHGINDALNEYDAPTQVVTETIFHKLQTFYQATMSLPGSQPPVVILLDSYLGYVSRTSYMEHSMSASTAVSQVISWYPNIWGISYANILRPYAYSHLTEIEKELPLLSSKGIMLHPGMMYHISIAWTIVFNLMHALHDHCVSSSLLSSDVSTSVSQGNDKTYLDVNRIPELTVDLKSLDIASKWKERITTNEQNDIVGGSSVQQQFDNQSATPITMMTKKTKHSSIRCYYVWMVNRLLRIKTPKQIHRVINPYMIHNDGWTSTHNDSIISPGWVANNGRGSYFELYFDDVPTTTISTLTIIFMQSYSEKWYNSTLQIDCIYTDILESDSPSTASSAASTTTIRHILSGYHEDQTSILIPTKLKLPPPPTTTTTIANDVDMQHRTTTLSTNTTTAIRRSLRINFQLLDGQTFKIAGMAIC